MKMHSKESLKRAFENYLSLSGVVGDASEVKVKKLNWVKNCPIYLGTKVSGEFNWLYYLAPNKVNTAGDLIFSNLFEDPDMVCEVIKALFKINYLDKELLRISEQGLKYEVFFSNSNVIEFYKLESEKDVSPGQYALALDSEGFNNMVVPNFVLPKEGQIEYGFAYEAPASRVNGANLAKSNLRSLFGSDLRFEESYLTFSHDSYLLGETVAKLHAYSSRAFAIKSGSLPELENALFLVTETSFDRPTKAERKKELSSIVDCGNLIITHSYLTLELFSRSDLGWILTSMGSPFKKTYKPPVYDLALLINSFKYSGEEWVLEQHADEKERCTKILQAWLQENLNAFLEGYFSYDAVNALWPHNEEDKIKLIKVFIEEPETARL